MVLQIMGLFIVMYLPETVTGLLFFFNLRDVGVSFAGPNSPFGPRLALTGLAVAVISAIWAVYVRRRVHRQARVAV